MATKLFDNTIGYEQPQTAASFFVAILSGEKRFKNLFLQFLLNTRTGVADQNFVDVVSSPSPAGDAYGPLTFHCLGGIDHEIHNHLVEPDRIPQNWRQLFTRPVARLNPYTTPLPNLFICSSATPPGGGVHGMCGYHAAMAVLQRS